MNEYIFTGAEFIHGENSLMFDLCKKYNLDNELVQVNQKIITNLHLQTEEQSEASDKIMDISDDEKIILICHELCMDIENIDLESIKIENDNWNCGNNNYLINHKIYSTIMNDLKTYPDNIYYNMGEINEKDTTEYDFTVNAYTPDNFIKLCHPAIKIFFTIDNTDGDNTLSILLGEKIMDIEVVEIWKNGNYFVLFATASRAIKINNLINKNEYINLIMEKILDKSDINSHIVDIHFHNYGYHYPYKKNVPENYCGEWTSQTFDSSLSGAIKSAYDMYDYIENNT